jgi:hypothetical protein
MIKSKFIIILFCLILQTSSWATDEALISDHQAEILVEVNSIENEIKADEKIAELESATIINRTEVNKGSTRKIFNRVLPEFKAVRKNTEASQAPAPASGEAFAMMIEQMQIKHHGLALSATVYDGKFTELKWQYEQKQYCVFSPINFHHFEGTPSFKDGDDDFLLLMTIGDAGSGMSDRWLPSAEDFGSDTLEYIVVEGDDNEEAFTAVDAMHRYYVKNKEDLIIRSTNLKKLSEAQKRYDAENPPVKRDTVTNFWPK